MEGIGSWVCRDRVYMVWGVGKSENGLTEMRDARCEMMMR